MQHIMPPGYLRRYKHKQVYSMMQVTPANPEEIAQHAFLQAHILPSQVRSLSQSTFGLILPNPGKTCVQIP